MSVVLKVVGGLWAALGIGNVFMMPWTEPSRTEPNHDMVMALTFGLLLNFVLFILPGLSMYGLGMIAAGHRQGPVEHV